MVVLVRVVVRVVVPVTVVVVVPVVVRVTDTPFVDTVVSVVVVAVVWSVVVVVVVAVVVVAVDVVVYAGVVRRSMRTCSKHGTSLSWLSATTGLAPLVPLVLAQLLSVEPTALDPGNVTAAPSRSMGGGGHTVR